MRIAIRHVGQQAHGGSSAATRSPYSATIGRRSGALPAAHRRCRAPSCADRASRTGPGRPSACGAGNARSCGPAGCMSCAFELDPRHRSPAHAQHREAGGRLAAAALAHQSQRLAARERERHAIHGLGPSPTCFRNSTPRVIGKCTDRFSTRNSSYAAGSDSGIDWLHPECRRPVPSVPTSAQRAAARTCRPRRPASSAARRRSPAAALARSGGCAVDRHQPLAGTPVEARHRGQQAAGVGMARRAIERARRRVLHYPTPPYITTTRSA